jgi:hypothetical protein
MILTRLTFFSRICLDRSNGTARHIAAILAASQINNQRDGITGAMIHDACWFAQELEGCESALSVTFERILRDPRHREVSLVTIHPAAERRYPEFALAGTMRGRDNDDLFRHYCDGESFDPREMRADRIADLVEAVTVRATATTHAA